MTTTPTHKLFWADPYRRRFTAQVLTREEGERPSITLNRTIFYPTSGGQPHDTGRLGGVRVLAVEQEDGRIQHYVDRLPPVEPKIVGEIEGIDWSVCGGTHVRSTAAIGAIAITRLERRGEQGASSLRRTHTSRPPATPACHPGPERRPHHHS